MILEVFSNWSDPMIPWFSTDFPLCHKHSAARHRVQAQDSCSLEDFPRAQVESSLSHLGRLKHKNHWNVAARCRVAPFSLHMIPTGDGQELQDSAKPKARSLWYKWLLLHVWGGNKLILSCWERGSSGFSVLTFSPPAWLFLFYCKHLSELKGWTDDGVSAPS